MEQIAQIAQILPRFWKVSLEAFSVDTFSFWGKICAICAICFILPYFLIW